MFDPPDDLLGPKEEESIFYKLSPPVKFSPIGERQKTCKAVSELTKPKLLWVIDSFYGVFTLRLLRYHISTGLPYLHNSAGWETLINLLCMGMNTVEMYFVDSNLFYYTPALQFREERARLLPYEGREERRERRKGGRKMRELERGDEWERKTQGER